MARTILKLDKKHDEYVIWQSVTDCPVTAIMSRVEVVKHMTRHMPEWRFQAEARMDWCDEHGTASRDTTNHGWDYGMVIHNVGDGVEGRWLPRKNLREFCHALSWEDMSAIRGMTTV